MIVCTFEDSTNGTLRHAVVDVIIVRDGQILLTKRAPQTPEAGKWAFPAGFVQRDETTLQAAARVVLKETGWEAENLALFHIKDSPNRRNEDRQNISFVFAGTAIKRISEPDNRGAEVRWLPLGALPSAEQFGFDHLEIIESYKQQLERPEPTPLLG